MRGKTLLIDGDNNQSSVDWYRAGDILKSLEAEDLNTKYLNNFMNMCKASSLNILMSSDTINKVTV